MVWVRGQNQVEVTVLFLPSFAPLHPQRISAADALEHPYFQEEPRLRYDETTRRLTVPPSARKGVG